MKKRKIIFLYPISIPYMHGATLYIDRIVSSISKDGHDVSVITSQSSSNDGFDDNSLYKRVIKRWSLTGFVLDSSYKYFKSMETDVAVIIYPYKVEDIAHYFIKLFQPKIRLVTIVFIPLKIEFPFFSFANIFSNFKSLISSFVLYATSSEIIFHDPKWCGVAKNIFFWKKNRIRFCQAPSIPKNENVLEYDVRKVAKRLKNLSKQHGLDPNMSYFAFAGFWTKSKGFDRAIEALHHIRSKLGRKDIGMIVVGGGRHKDEEIYYDLINKYYLKDPAIKIINKVSDAEMLELMVSCNLFCAPYRKVLFGRSTISMAASLGMPVVASKYKNYRGTNFLKNNVNSFLVSEGDIQELSEKIVELIDDKDRNNEMSSEMKKISHLFTWQNLKKEIVG